MTTAATAPSIKRLSYRFDLKEIDGEPGTFEGYGNVFGVVDWHQEVVTKGAFKKTLKDKKSAKQPIVLLWQHDTKQPIGTLEASEDDHGLMVKARLTLGVRQADEAYLLLKSGAVGSMSIGFDVLRDEYDRESGVRYLKEIRLWEVSLVTFPANEASTVTAVKASDVETRLAAIEQRLEVLTKSLAEAPEPTDTLATPSDPQATEAADNGTPAGKSALGAGTEPDTPGDDLAAVMALAQQIKDAASEQRALKALNDLRQSMSA